MSEVSNLTHPSDYENIEGQAEQLFDFETPVQLHRSFDEILPTSIQQRGPNINRYRLEYSVSPDTNEKLANNQSFLVPRPPGQSNL